MIGSLASLLSRPSDAHAELESAHAAEASATAAWLAEPTAEKWSVVLNAREQIEQLTRIAEAAKARAADEERAKRKRELQDAIAAADPAKCLADCDPQITRMTELMVEIAHLESIMQKKAQRAQDAAWQAERLAAELGQTFKAPANPLALIRGLVNTRGVQRMREAGHAHKRIHEWVDLKYANVELAKLPLDRPLGPPTAKEEPSPRGFIPRVIDGLLGR